jgi:hypothetical protein
MAEMIVNEIPVIVAKLIPVTVKKMPMGNAEVNANAIVKAPKGGYRTMYERNKQNMYEIRFLVRANGKKTVLRAYCAKIDVNPLIRKV